MHQRGSGLRDEVPEVEGVKFGGESSDAKEGEKDGEEVRVAVDEGDAARGSAHGTGEGGEEGVGIIGGTEGRRRGRDQWGWGICHCAARRRRIFTSLRSCLSTIDTGAPLLTPGSPSKRDLIICAAATLSGWVVLDRPAFWILVPSLGCLISAHGDHLNLGFLSPPPLLCSYRLQFLLSRSLPLLVEEVILEEHIFISCDGALARLPLAVSTQWMIGDDDDPSYTGGATPPSRATPHSGQQQQVAATTRGLGPPSSPLA
ncbi:hypothetical protein Taro_039701 [Colocasia esculenta]|uniref:Uncharacterized protein n=1 Tax=Colocasia esculenta TaxID=4460 RepID=A0A843WWG2_COLES|nr:hypothetical protein [Colocasia esculenta]